MEEEEGAEEGGRGRGTAREVSRWGNGRVKSGLRRGRLARPGGGGCSGVGFIFESLELLRVEERERRDHLKRAIDDGVGEGG